MAAPIDVRPLSTTAVCGGPLGRARGDARVDGAPAAHPQDLPRLPEAVGAGDRGPRDAARRPRTPGPKRCSVKVKNLYFHTFVTR
eukprot:3060500-Prymnesium_polylepis.1